MYLEATMKKFLALCAGMMLLASAAMAQTNGLQLAWNACANTAGATPAQAFDCDPASLLSPFSLYATFSLATPATNIIASDQIVDFIYPNTPDHIPPFWHFEGLGCNEFGLGESHIKPVNAVCAATNDQALCGVGGSFCISFTTGYVFGSAVNFPENRARLFISVARQATQPTTIGNTTRHYMFGLSFAMDNAITCAGCADPVGIPWNSAVRYTTSATTGQEAPVTFLSSTDPGSTPSVGVNCTSCVTVSAKTKTWGQLKSLYR